MKVRGFTEADYTEVAKWWVAHGWQPVPPGSLPIIGMIVESPKNKLCAGWIYQTDSDIAWLEWVVGNPEADKMERSEALDMLVQSLLRAAKERGHSAIFTTLRHERLIERYKKHGFKVTDENMTCMIGRI